MSKFTEGSPVILFIDLQFDFTRPGGACYNPRSSPIFIREVLFPFIRDNHMKCAQVISDYRQPRPGDPRDCCKPGEWGYASEVPDDILTGGTWIKCMNSPIWIRSGIGDARSTPGVPRQDPVSFDRWLEGSLGSQPGRVVLAGLTLDSCILCAAQELTFRGYEVLVLDEATDTRSGSPQEKDLLIRNPPLTFWSRPIDFSNLMHLLSR